MTNPLPYARQDISEDDIAAVAAVLRSDWITQGPAIERFEKSVADISGARFAVTTSSATAALHIGVLALGLSPGKRLWTTPNSFVASSNCALYCGADVDFVDIDPVDGNMSTGELERKLAEAEQEDKLPDIVVPVYFAGQPCNMETIHGLSDRYGFKVIEDASHAIGGRYQNTPVGNGRSDLTVFSFHPVKIVTTGEGGMLTTNSEALYKALLRLRSHGITKDTDEMPEPVGPWSYAQIELGFNYRITDIQAALGASQISRLTAYVERRNFLSQRYDEFLSGLPLTPLKRHSDRLSACHLYVVRFADADVRQRIYEGLRQVDIFSQVHYIPIHLQPHYRKLGFAPGDFPESEAHYREALSLPLFPTMTEADQDRVVERLTDLLAETA